MDMNTIMRQIKSDWRERLDIKLVNYEKECDRLEGCIYSHILDLAAVVVINMDRDESETTLRVLWVKDNVLPILGASRAEVIDIALANSRRKEIRAIDFIEGFESYGFSDGPWGASLLIRHDFLRKICRKFSRGKDKLKPFYIIPASTDDLIFCAYDLDRSFIESAIWDINRDKSIVSPSKRLSDNTYIYIPEIDKAVLTNDLDWRI